MSSTVRSRRLRRAVGRRLLLCFTVVLLASASDIPTSLAAKLPRPDEARRLECAYAPPTVWLEELQAAVERGEIADPKNRPIPAIPGSEARAKLGGETCLTAENIFPFEDTAQLLLTDFSSGQLSALMTDAANALMATHGDHYDFIGFWVNFTPDHTIGTAFYSPIENDTAGLGDPSTQGTPIFNSRPDLGLGGQNVEGYVMMWNINSTFWAPGDGPDAEFTRLVLGQEFEHRWALFLPSLLDGRALQGDNSGCGRIFHWNWQIDGQGSSMEISEWVSQDPTFRINGSLNFNGDTDGVFGPSDLYLMGYLSPAEMDSGNRALRFMDNSGCGSSYTGTISDFSSAEIVAAAGARVPDAAASQKHFRTGWVMIHLPGDPPDQAELDKAAVILQQHELDWRASTLGRGSMINTLFEDCDCNQIRDADDIAMDPGLDLDGNGVLDGCQPASCQDPQDMDQDGVGDGCDNCPAVANADQYDADRDQVGDACDNCFLALNSLQSDSNSDAEGDACDLDDGEIYIQFKQADRVDWHEELPFPTWNSYRSDLNGFLSSGEYTQAPGSNPLASQQCGLVNAFTPDSVSPGPGEVTFYLTSGVDSVGTEFRLGKNSAGVLRPNDNACP